MPIVGERKDIQIMGEMRELGKQGDTKIVWDAEKEDEVKVARSAFNSLKKKGYSAYAVKRNGDPGLVINKFDPDAEKIIMALPMQGG